MSPRSLRSGSPESIVAPARRRVPARETGIALFSVLWIVALLAIAALGVAATTRSEARMTGNLLQATRARYAAEGAVEIAVARLLAPGPSKWPADGSKQRLRIGEARLEVAIFNESGKVDLNTASAQLLQRLVSSVEPDPDRRSSLVDAILDWRDADGLRRLNGSEDDDYSAAGYAYGAKDSHFDSVDELGLVMGMTPGLLQRVRPYLTVHSGQTGIDPNAAPRELLTALTGEDPLAPSPDGAAPWAASDPQPAAVPLDEQFVTGSSGPVYTIQVESRLAEAIVSRLTVTVMLVGGTERYRLLDWRPDADLFREPAGG